MLEPVREWLAGGAAEAAFVTSPVAIAYLTGYRGEAHERLQALVVRPESATLIVPALDQEKARAAVAGVEVAGWRDGEDPYLEVAAALGRGRLRLAVETEHLSLAGWERLDPLVEGGPVDVGAELRRLRARKSTAELGLLTRAAEITDVVSERLLDQVRSGQTELELAALLARLMSEAAADPAFSSLVQSGPNSALPHQVPTPRPVEAGDLLLLDFGAACGGYRADITRTVTIERADPRAREIHALVLEAHDAAIATVRAGITAGEVDTAARAVIEKAGLGARFIHRVGHGLGLEAHEAPSLDPGSKTVLEAGMVITIEPGVYIPGWGGVRIEDDLVVEAAGSRLLTSADRSLRVVG
ncbi:MAG: Xaa-Pro peptidase family protein [Candidatus Dormibacteraeota bacterium]|nr:Xaa-Pro peptidase family protein [Candidatus Dormibacteraeota bacterium]